MVKSGLGLAGWNADMTRTLSPTPHSRYDRGFLRSTEGLFRII
jgi:hypothetical protein